MANTTFQRSSEPNYSLKQLPTFATAVTKFSGAIVLAGSLHMTITDDGVRNMNNRTFFAHEVQRTANVTSANRSERSVTYSGNGRANYPSVHLTWDAATQKVELLTIGASVGGGSIALEDKITVEEKMMESKLFVEKQIFRTYTIAIVLFSILAVISFLSWIGLGFLPSPIDKTLLLTSLAGLAGFSVDNWKRERLNDVS